MNLLDWASNDAAVLDEILFSDRSLGHDIKVLGLTWTMKDDQLSVNHTNFDQTSDLTKWAVLKQIASVYDPLGLFSPVTLQGKLFLQKLWIKRLDWDESLSCQDKIEWNKIRKELAKLTICIFPRYIGLNGTKCDQVSYRLLGFCDASKHAYAAVVYLHQRKGDSCRVNLVFSKLSLAPSKTVSIPRLELLAGLIGTRAIQFVAEHLRLKLTQKHLWSDSQCVLNWIASGKHSSKFVENRLVEIGNHKDIVFHYIPSKDNPADLASRGTCINELLNNKLWWHGPEWLLQLTRVWRVWNENSSNQDTKGPVVMYQAKLFAGEDNPQTAQITSTDNGPFGMDKLRYSSMIKLLRLTALVCRFINRLKRGKSSNGPVQASEIEQVEKLWIEHI